jgi:hypothetical protein
VEKRIGELEPFNEDLEWETGNRPRKPFASFKAEQDKSRREQALANATGMRVLQTIVATVPVRNEVNYDTAGSP